MAFIHQRPRTSLLPTSGFGRHCEWLSTGRSRSHDKPAASLGRYPDRSSSAGVPSRSRQPCAEVYRPDVGLPREGPTHRTGDHRPPPGPPTSPKNSASPGRAPTGGSTGTAPKAPPVCVIARHDPAAAPARPVRAGKPPWSSPGCSAAAVRSASRPSPECRRGRCPGSWGTTKGLPTGTPVGPA